LRLTLSDLHFRLAGLEELITNAKYQELREKLVAGEVTMEDIDTIVTETVVPKAQAAAEEAHADMQQKMAELQESGGQTIDVSHDSDNHGTIVLTDE
jgi:hypothetical protein